jgi:putative chitinase
VSDVSPLVLAITEDRGWVLPIVEACVEFDIDTHERQAMFLANCAHESAGFTQLVESLKYSPTRLMAVFSRYFTAREAEAFAYDEVRIAERVYGGRMGNGPEGMGDGWMYRGRGLLQITGLDMYRRCGRTLGVDFEHMPSLLEGRTFAARSAGWVWTVEKKCNIAADMSDFARCVVLINGGTNGMDDRLAWLDRLRDV